MLENVGGLLAESLQGVTDYLFEDCAVICFHSHHVSLHTQDVPSETSSSSTPVLMAMLLVHLSGSYWVSLVCFLFGFLGWVTVAQIWRQRVFILITRPDFVFAEAFSSMSFFSPNDFLTGW